MIFVSCHEPKPVRSLAKLMWPDSEEEQWPESYGVDFAWVTPFGYAGVQRKQFPGDFLSSKSKADGRLEKEIQQMEQLQFRCLILEGNPLWGTNGELQGQFRGGITKKHLYSMIMSMTTFKGILVIWTGSMSETLQMIDIYYSWTSKEKHTQFDPIGMRKARTDFRMSAMLALPDMGRSRARAILKYEPRALQWWNGGRDLEKVEGIGKKMANKLRACLEPQENPE